MKLLLLGGTRFVGHHLVAAARARGHELTLFHRGTHAAPDVEEIRGDRHRDLAKLRGRRWDALIDTCGYLPMSVKASAEALATAVEQYVFVSSISVYADLHARGVDETAVVATLTRQQLQQANAIELNGSVSGSTYGAMYGPLKALCERAAEDAMPGRVLSLRPGLIVGPHDYTDRFTYWVTRVARGGEVLAPGDPRRYVQFIDVRDLAEWTIAMVERRHCGVFNVNGPLDTVTMGELLNTCRTVSGSDASFTWVSESLLRAEQVTPWTELPLWLPDGHRQGLMAIDVRKAVAAGLRFRPLEETVRATLQWSAGRALHASLAVDRERQLLNQHRSSL